jgi:hypothetical protein
MANAPLTLDAAISFMPDVVFKDIRGEGVILNMSTGIYFGLDETSTRIWQLIAAHQSLRRVFEHMLEEFDVEPKRLEQDLLGFVGELINRGLAQTTISSSM